MLLMYLINHSPIRAIMVYIPVRRGTDVLSLFSLAAEVRYCQSPIFLFRLVFASGILLRDR